MATKDTRQPGKLLWRGRSHSTRVTHVIGKALGEQVQPGTMIALIGELGAGKTQMVRGIAEGIGADPRIVSSPTYVIAQEYPAGDQGPVLVHVDGYRLNTESDLDSIGWPDLVASDTGTVRADTILTVEWADRIRAYLPSDRLEVSIEHADEQERDIEMTAVGRWDLRKLQVMEESLQNTATTASGGSDSLPNTDPTSTPSYRCPTCRKVFCEQGPSYPFCCNRCKTIDLGRWASGDYIISRPIEHSDLDEGE